MRRHFLSLLVAIVATAMSLNAQTIVIDDGFENGIQDSIWTQEYVVGHGSWQVESVEDGLSFPDTTRQGNKRAYLRNNTGETQGYVTRLVSKVMDLSPDKVYQPELTFWYANPKWTADRDTLRVLYRTSAKAKWQQMAEFSTASANWQKVSISLPEVNETYQIAFEGTDNLGRGIVLDSVKLRSAPECTIPHDVTISDLGNGKVNIAWLASWDADNYELIVTKDAIIDPDTVSTVPASVLALHEVVDGLQQNYDAQLVSGETYYVYLRSLCAAENSAWNSEDPNQGQFKFRVMATKYLPYSYGFNMDYHAGYISRDPEWTWGTNATNSDGARIYTPHINTNLNPAELAKYSNDGTQALCFCGLYSSSSVPDPIPAGAYAYAASPALNDTTVADFALKTCQVRFWATVFTYTGRTYAHKIIIGVMTDPSDITTFVPVDTVSVWGTKTYQENIVDLGSYSGDGKFVAFLSNFDERNKIFVDNVVIEQKPAINKVTKINVNPRDTYAEISWEGNASSYRVLVTNEEVDVANPKPTAVVADTTLAGNQYVCEVLEADHNWNRPYYVYVKAQGADWSYRYPFVTIAGLQEMPIKFDMEEKDGSYFAASGVKYPTRMGLFSNDPEYPHLYTTNPYKGSSTLYLSKDPGNDSWITFPMLDSIQDKQMTFFLSGNTTASQVHATVGVMSNPMDINTFVPVSDFVNAAGYIRCYVNFSEYKGENGVIAIVWGDVEGLGKNTNNYIDDITIEQISSCLPPINLSAEPADQSVTISWDKSNHTQWEVVVSTQSIAEAEWDELASVLKRASVIQHDTLELSDIDKVPTFEIDSLRAATEYYVYLRTLCSVDEQSWWTPVYFRTTCSEKYALPYTFDFEGQPTGSGTYPLCWTGGNYSFSRSSATATYGYPYLTTTAHSGGASLYMYSYYYKNSSTGVVTSNYGSMAVAPKMDAPLNEMLVEFWAYAASLNYELYVGTVSAPDDSVFVPLDTIKFRKTSTWTKYTVDFTRYTGSNEYIAFRTYNGKASNTVYIDDVTFKSARCAPAYNIRGENVNPTDMDVAWSGMTDDKWEVKVLSKYARLNTEKNLIAKYDTAKVAIVNDTIMDGKVLHLSGLKTLTKYYVYVRPTCGDSTWVVDSVKTGCTRINPNIVKKETFESYKSGTSYDATYQADCWTTGNANPTAGTTYLPYIYKGSTYAGSGENVYRLNETSASSPAWVASPEIECDSMSNLLVSFSFYASSSYYGVWGVMTDPEDLNTFIALDSLKGSASLVTVNVDLRDYADTIPAEARYFGWRGRYNAADLFYIDDVVILEQSCPIVKPSYSDLTSERVRISSGLRVDNDWLLMVMNQEVSADSLNDDKYVCPDSIIVFSDTLDTRSKIVTGLKEKTDYYVAVASYCEGKNPYWVVLSFKTPCESQEPEQLGTRGVITFSDAEGYVSGSSATRYLPCWTIGSKTLAASSSYIPYVNNTASLMHNGNKYLYLYDYVSSSSVYVGAYAIMPILNVDDISKYQVSFFARSNTTASHNNQVIVGIITDPSDLNTFTVTDTLTLSKSAYEAFTVSFENYEGDYLGNKGKYIMFLSEFGMTNSACISEISVERIPACRPVESIVVDSLGQDFAIFSLESKAEKVRFLLADEELANDSIKNVYTDYLVDTLITDYDSILIKGLEPGELYYAYAQNICGADTAKVSVTFARFLTDCPTTKAKKVPYFTNFDNNSATGTGNKPDCWDGVYLTKDTVGTSQSYPYVNATVSNAYTPSNSLYIYSSGSSSSSYKSYAVAPLVAGNLADYMVSFYARQSTATATTYGKTLVIGYVTDASQKQIAATFVPLTTVEVSGTVHQYYEANLTTLGVTIPAGARIALKADWSVQTGLTASTKYANFYIDNFRIGLPPTCYAPVLEAGKTTLTTAEVKITPAKEGNNLWELSVIPDSVYSKINKIENYLDTTTNLITADSLNFVVSGLAHSTTYQVFARTVCGGEDGKSVWTENPLQVITQYYYKDSYAFGFETTEDWVRSPLSTSDTYYMHPALVAGYDTLGGSSKTTSYSYYPYAIENTSTLGYGYGPKDGSAGKGALRLYAYKSSTANYYGPYVIFPAIDKDEAQARSFEFKARPGYLTLSSMKTSTTYASQLQVGTVDRGEGIETFELLATIDLPAMDKSIVAAPANDFLFSSFTLDLDSVTIADKQLVLYQPQVVKGTTSCYNYIDNVKLGAVKGYGLVSLGKIEASSNSATIHWSKTGGPWNLYVTTVIEDPETFELRTDTVAKYENVSDVTSQVITGLQPQKDYTVILNPVNAPAKSAYSLSSTKTFTTPCTPLEANAAGEFFWDFNDPSEWEASDMICANYNVTNAHDTAFHKPGCFTMGWNYYAAPSTTTVNYNWMIIRKGINYASTSATGSNYSATYAKYEYGRNDSPALKIFNSTTNTNPYFVLPELNCDLDTMMVEFYGRCFANYANDHGTPSNQNKMVAATYLGASYCQSVIVGTMTDPQDFSTFEAIDTLSYKQTSLPATTKVTEDPANLRYWEKMQAPLSGAKGKYIAIYQPAHGLFFLDDLSIKPIGNNIFAPSGAATGDVTKTTAEFSWRVKHPSLQSVVVVLNADEDDKEVIRDTIVGTNYTATGLKPATIYKWYMYQINGEAKSSETGRLSFTTDCDGITPDYTTGFESDVEGFWILPAQTSTTYKQNKCWTYGNAGTSAVGTNIYNYQNTATIGYSHDGQYALRLYAYSTTIQTYAAMPAMDVAAYDTLQINFWMRPGYHGLGTSTYAGKISTQHTLGSSAATKEYYYAKSVIVGTMTDPNDKTTFVPIDTINYIGTLAQGDETTAANDYLFQKKKVALRGATGPYVAFMATLYAKDAENKSTYDYVWIDDVWFSQLQECSEVTSMETKGITSSSATLSWKGDANSKKYYLQVSTDADFYYDTAFVYNDTVEADFYELKNLVPHTTYAWRVKTICGEEYGESEYSQNGLFTTARIPFFLEDFRNPALDADWNDGINPAIEVLDSANVEIGGTASTSSYGFHRVTTNYGIHGAHYCVPFYSSSTVSSTTYDYYWLLSPTIYLEEGKSAHMTMDMALTQSSTTTPNANPATAANIADDFTFMIILSDDGGKTWKKENIIGIWNDTIAGAQKLSSIPMEATNLRVDLSKYEGKNIRLGFYRQAETYLSTTSAVHIGNLRVSYYDNFEVDTTACQYQDIEAYDMFVNGDSIPAGSYELTHIEKAGELAAARGAIDTIYIIKATVYEAPETIQYDTICAGESYSDMNFTGKSRTGVYRRKLQSALSCDSIITLHLFVAPKETSSEFDTICYGASYKWQGKEYNRSGLYSDTLLTQYGCDSIIYLNLLVRDQITGAETREICAGGSTTWNGKVYDQAGSYKETLTAACGCDSIATLTVEVSEIIHGTPQQETICHGGKFTWNGKVYDKAGVYTDTVQSIFGCDSVNTLELSIAPIIEGDPDVKTICSGNTYTWNGKILSKPGTYKDTLKTVEGCDSVAILTLQIADIIIGAPVNVAICEGASYTWNGKVYDKAGTYKDTLQSAGGCDSVATIVLSVSSVLHGEPEKVGICEGESYKWNGKDYTLPGTYVDTVASSYGCDSIITLVLTYYAAEDTIRIDSTIALAQLPFTYENAAHPYVAGQAPISYAEGTAVGTYSDTVLVEGAHCTAVMILNLTIQEEQGINNIGANDIVLLPNVIRAGESVTAYGNFTGNVHIQVYDIVGRLVQENRSDAKSSISIDAFPQSGIYTVRISDSDATQYVGRVLVK